MINKTKIKELTTDFLNYINQKDLESLNSYGITPDVFEEIEETLNDVSVDLSISDLEIKLIKDVFQFENGNYGVEIALKTTKND